MKQGHRPLAKLLKWHGIGYEVLMIDPESPYFNMRASSSDARINVPPVFVLVGPRSLYGLIPWLFTTGDRTLRVVNLHGDQKWNSTPFGKAGFKYVPEEDGLEYCCRFRVIRTPPKITNSSGTMYLLPLHS